MTTIQCMRSARKFLHDIRWFMEYEDGRLVNGHWGKGAKELRASAQSKEGLVRVGIEANDKLSNKCSRVCIIEGSNFDKFRWVVSTNIPAVTLKDFEGSLKLVPFHEGLTVVSLDGSEFTFFIDGEHEAKGIS